MPEYRRTKIAGGTFFFTVVTYQRKPIFTSEFARSVLHNAWENTQKRFPFFTDAICLLPDHIHCIWTLPEGDTNFSIRWREIKRTFTMNFREPGVILDLKNTSRIDRKEETIWQRRFWEHLIRDENDLNNHLNYIHYNPVKHGLVERVCDWRWSSFQRYVQMGFYDPDWGQSDQVSVDFAAGE